MLIQKNYLLLLLPFSLSACFGGSSSSTVAQKSSDVSYTSASALGAAVNDAAAIDSGPEITSNELELYFHSNRAGGAGLFDLWVSTRASTAASWGTATNTTLANINSSFEEKAPTLSDDGLTLIFASNRNASGDYDLYVSTRTSLVTAWSVPTAVAGLVNTTNNEEGPSLSADGLSLYFHSDDPAGFGNSDLYVATRASISDPWSAGVNLGATVNSAEFDVAPEISSDGLTLYFHSTRTGGPGSHDIWRTTRPRVSSAWTTPVAMPAPVNTSVSDLAPSLSDDFQTLYFASDFGGNRDIWQAVP